MTIKQKAAEARVVLPALLQAVRYEELIPLYEVVPVNEETIDHYEGALEIIERLDRMTQYKGWTDKEFVRVCKTFAKDDAIELKRHLDALRLYRDSNNILQDILKGD